MLRPACGLDDKSARFSQCERRIVISSKFEQHAAEIRVGIPVVRLNRQGFLERVLSFLGLFLLPQDLSVRNVIAGVVGIALIAHSIDWIAATSFATP